jgi:hypothetical protein
LAVRVDDEGRAIGVVGIDELSQQLAAGSAGEASDASAPVAGAT